MSGWRLGQRVGVVKGCLQGYYGHVTTTHPCVGIRLQGDRYGESNPRFFTGEWFLPTDYLEYVD